MTNKRKNSHDALRAMLKKSNQPQADCEQPSTQDILSAIRARRPQNYEYEYTPLEIAHFETLDQTDKWAQLLCKHLQMRHFCYRKNIRISDETEDFYTDLKKQMEKIGYDVEGLTDFLVDKYQLCL